MRFLLKISSILIILGSLILVYMFIEPYLIETKEIVVESDQIPPQFDGKRIVFLVDIHAGPSFDQNRVDNLVKQVNDLHPDIILLGGDYVDRDAEYVKPVFESLQKLEAPLGVYAVLGNNDPQILTWDTLENSNITDLTNQGKWIEYDEGRIRICGVGDYNNDVQDQETAIGDAQADDYVVLLSHNPDYYPHVDNSLVDLVLSGHTHGGQVTFFGLWAPIVRSEYGQKYLTGVHKENNTTLIVSNGIGTVIAPMRFFARPQIIVVDLKSK